MNREAIHKVLNALEPEPFWADWYLEGVVIPRAIEILKQALAEPEQEQPVAWGYELATTVGEHGYDGWSRRLTQHKPNVPEGSIRNLTPLYTAPTPRKEKNT